MSTRIGIVRKPLNQPAEKTEKKAQTKTVKPAEKTEK